MSKFSEAYLLGNIFNFEVPLEDLSPSNYLHPKILIMYNQAFKSFNINNITLDLLLSSKKEDPENKLKLKKSVLSFKHPKQEGTPQSYIWLIEHFLGLLPIPLLASYVNGYSFKWLDLSQQCREIYQDRNFKRKIINFNSCDRHIRNEIAKLPSQHQLLLNLHIEFMRRISSLNGNKRKRSIILYSKYFTASLLVRPFRSGLNDHSEKQYYALVLYMAIRWPVINEIPVEHILTKMREMRESESSILKTSSHDEIGNREHSTRLDYYTPSNSNNVNNRNDTISSFSSIPEIEQKPRGKEELSASSISNECGRNSNKQQSEETETKVYSLIEKQPTATNDLNSMENITIKNEPTVDCPEKKNATSKMNQKNSVSDFRKLVVKSEQILGNKHKGREETQKIRVNSLSNIYENTTKKDMIPPISSGKNPESITIDTDTLKRISKIGWTYTPPTKKQLDETNQIKNITNDEITKQELIKSSQSDITLKKYPSVKSLKSRLSFLKRQRKKSGFGKLDTNFKYTKINS